MTPWCYSSYRFDDGVSYCILDDDHDGDHKDKNGRTWEEP